MIEISDFNQRPGVYSSYTVSSRYGTPRSKLGATLICGVAGNVNSVIPIADFSGAKETMGEHSSNRLPLAYCQLLFESGVSRITLINKYYQDIDEVITSLDELKELGFILADYSDDESCAKLMKWATQQSESQKEAICFFARNESSDALALARQLNHSRGVVCCPDTEYNQQKGSLFSACGLAGKLLAENKPNCNLNGFELTLLENPKDLSEKEIQRLISGGVCVLEKIGNLTECVRGVTSCTNIDGTVDYSMRSINTILIIDDVMRTLRSSLRAKLKGTGIGTNSLDSIASQVLIELAAKEQDGVIKSYQLPRVYSSDSDPTLCIVEISFNVAHVISQIHITAHIGL